MEFSAKQIAEYVKGTICGDENVKVHTFATIENGVPGAISFLSNPKYTHYIYDTQASIVLVNKDFEPERAVRPTLIKVENAYECLAKLMTLYEASKTKKTGIDPLASVAPSAKIGENVYIAPFACIEDGAEIGDNAYIHPHVTVGSHAKVGNNTTLYPHVTIYHDCRIGNNCILHGGCVIGADGFGFAPSPEGFEKIPQIGIVIIEDNVEEGTGRTDVYLRLYHDSGDDVPAYTSRAYLSVPLRQYARPDGGPTGIHFSLQTYAGTTETYDFDYIPHP